MEVVIKKVDPSGKRLAGASLTLEMDGGVDEIVDGGNVLFSLSDGAGRETTADLPDAGFDPVSWTTTDTEDFVIRLESGSYTLTENSAPAGYAVSDPIEFEVTDDGKILINGAEAEDVTMTDAFEYHDLSVSKVVKGSLGNKTKKFKFHLTLTDSDMEGLPSSSVTGLESLADISLQNGVCEFELRHGETISFRLPYGAGYKVEELDADGYEVEATGAEGIIGNTDAAASFTNTKEGSVPTGFKASTGLAAGFGILSGILALSLILYQIYRKKK